MRIVNKIVQFDKYCHRCMYRNNPEDEDPCFECLENPVNQHTDEPVYFKEGKAKVIKTRKEEK